MSVSEFIKRIQGYEEYAFSPEELRQNLNRPISTIRKELKRLSDQSEIVNLRHSFYLIIPPRYQHFQRLPIQLYINKLFSTLRKKYYVGLYSAAGIYGAAHQRTQEDYIITEPPALLSIEKGNIKIRFLKKTKWPPKNIVEMKSDAGLYKVSSPALTYADLIHYQTHIGGLSRVSTVLEELTTEISNTDLKELLSWYSEKSSLQRMGYFMEMFGASEGLLSLIQRKLEATEFYPVLLSPKGKSRAGSVDNRWKVDVNLKLENDLT